MAHPLVIFIIGMVLLALFIWYFGADNDKSKRNVGTALVLGLVGFCLYAVIPPSERISLGMDLSGGARFTLKFDTERQLSKEDRLEAANVLRERLKGSSPVERDYRVYLEGEDRVIVEIPQGKVDAEPPTAKQLAIWEKTLTEAAQLNFHMTSKEDKGFANDPSETKPGTKLFPIRPKNEETEEGEPVNRPEFLLVNSRVEISGKEVKGARAFNDKGSWGIGLELNSKGAKKFLELSQEFNVQDGTGDRGRTFAIVLDDVVLSSPQFNEQIAGGNAQITGDFTEVEAKGLATAMQNPLQAPMQVLHKDIFPPTLAKAAISQGVRSMLIGVSLTILFMIIFYRLAGLVALIGLTVNMILLFGVLAIFGADFTLTGIAGVILTLGMSIDANVLIYERLREERAAGKSLRASIVTAYDKAFSAIFDANITTLITALILFTVAVGAIKGFAVTLSIGIVVSLFSALLVTRVVFTWGHDTGAIKNLNFMSVLSNRAIDFLKKARVTRVFSVILVIVGLAMMITKGKDSMGIDFVGGDQVRFQVPDNVTKDQIQTAVDSVELSREARIQHLKPLGDSAASVSIRVAKDEGEKVLAALRAAGIDVDDAGAPTPPGDEAPEGTEGDEAEDSGPVAKTGATNIDPEVAGEMKSKSIWALCLGLLAILAYVTVRFEFSFALGAIVAVIHDLLITTGIVILLGLEINLVLVGAFLTIAGYSINDTIVVFDRIRENLRTKRGEVKDVMNLAINTTLSRTVLTSVTTLLTLLALFLAGGPALSEFSLTVIIGIIIGTYSSIFVASPIVYWWAKMRGTDLRHEVLEADQEKLPSVDMDLAPDT